MAYETTTTSPRYVPLGVRLLLTLAGAAGLIAGAFSPWVEGLKGTDIAVHALWREDFQITSTFTSTTGFVAIALGLAGIIGLGLWTGWLTRLAGVLGIVVFVLFTIEIYRSSVAHDVGRGAWLVLAGSIVLLIAGFVGAGRTLVTRSSPDRTTATGDRE